MHHENVVSLLECKVPYSSFIVALLLVRRHYYCCFLLCMTSFHLVLGSAFNLPAPKVEGKAFLVHIRFFVLITVSGATLHAWLLHS